MCYNITNLWGITMENDINESGIDTDNTEPVEENDSELKETSTSSANVTDTESREDDSTVTVIIEKNDETNSISSDLIRGHINTIILRALYERDKYGYEIIDDIEAKSHGQYTLKQPTLYSALKRLENQGYIKAYWKTDEVSSGGRRKYFTLTESGKMITEKNLSEWEYSRTIIDSLISDRSFDFSNPAPTPVDFTLLRDSVSRVPIIRSDESGRSENEQPVSEQKTPTVEEKPEPLTPQQIIAEQEAETVESVQCVQTVQYVQLSDQPEETAEKKTEAPATENNPVVQQPQQTIAEQPAPEKVIEEQPAPQHVIEEQPTPIAPQYTQEQSTAYSQQSVQSQQIYTQTVQEEQSAQTIQTEQSFESVQAARMQQAEEEARRRTHENYLKLISEPVRTKPAEDVVPESENIDSEKLIYNNKPETERDYKNLIDGIFYKTVANGSVQTTYYSNNNQASQRKQRQQQANSHLVERGRADGVSITPSNEANASRATRTTYNKGLTLLKSSAIVLAILVIEAILCFAFMKDLGVNWVYPSVILAIGVAQFTVFGILTLNGYGRNSVRPTSNGYISTCIILTIIGILIIAMLSFIFNMNTASVSDVMKMLVIPSLTALNITVFSLCFKLFLK